MNEPSHLSHDAKRSLIVWEDSDQCVLPQKLSGVYI